MALIALTLAGIFRICFSAWSAFAGETPDLGGREVAATVLRPCSKLSHQILPIIPQRKATISCLIFTDEETEAQTARWLAQGHTARK